MGSFDMEGLAYFAMVGMAAALVIAGGIGGFAIASVVNIGKLCL
jgi:hypothetical protein